MTCTPTATCGIWPNRVRPNGWSMTSPIPRSNDPFDGRQPPPSDALSVVAPGSVTFFVRTGGQTGQCQPDRANRSATVPQSRGGLTELVRAIPIRTVGRLQNCATPLSETDQL